MAALARVEEGGDQPQMVDTQAAVGKAASHAGQTTQYLTPMRGKASMLKLVDRQYLRGLTACQAHCGAVQDDRPMDRVDALREREDRAHTRAVQTS